MKRLLLCLAVLPGALLLLSYASPETARADAPSQQGWWTVTNPGGLPTPSLSAGPDVPAKGLLVEGGGQKPSAIAALIYPLSQGATVSDLTLKVAPNTITTTGVTLQVCPLVSSTINAQEGGPMADAPQYDCAHQTTATPHGSSYQFNVASLASAGTLAVAILPTKGSDRVVFDQPDASSLAVRAAAALTPESSPNSVATAATSPAPATLGGPSPSPAASPAVALGPAPAAVSSPALATPAQNNAATAQQSPTGFLPAHSSGGGGTNPAAVAAVLAGLLLAGGLWLFAGHTAARAAMAGDE
jgi:hypothetical protein